MKKILLPLFLLILTSCIVGCKKKSRNTPELPNTNPETPVTEAAFVYTEDTKLYVGYEAGEKTFTFKANVENWVATVEENAKWLTVSPASGDKGEQTLTIAYTQNDDDDERQGTITVSSAEQSFVIKITQSGLDIFTVMDDKNFKAFCEQFDLNKDGKLSLNEAKQVTEMVIKSIEAWDIKSLKALNTLQIWNCPIFQ